ncbi:flagellar motor switch protein FliN/FliY [Rhodoferax sp. OV413]|jgi:flagellar motor switch protein FliN/FliY|uniref:flagellar motor switch protein FliN n=1 Tax=Rhodoferax sp. OV413 TaxID=1855285 RepID=UPI0008840908|nr:flagellar motor switch protein FliN [Rhodoferax sp. OV413]SDP93279.1 flagellar motor switch protein FliN/FliY [Rhodoferax sp. OV413]
MATDNKNDEAEDPMAAWAEALEEQKVSDAKVEDIGQGGPLFGGNVQAKDGTSQDINMVLDIPVTLSVELGRTKVPIKYILQLAQGSVVELDALAGEPMDVLINGYLIAQGEVVVVNDKFGIRLTDVVTPSERLKRLSKG